MKMASKLLLGEHDFSSFRGSLCVAKSPIRTIHSIDIFSSSSSSKNCNKLDDVLISNSTNINKGESDINNNHNISYSDYSNSTQLMQSDDDMITIFVKGNKFLHRMVRLIIGALLEVGTGKLTIDQFKSVLDSRDIKANTSPCAAAHGLYLVNVHY